MTVYKSPTCGCCGEWVKHMRANGFSVTVHDVVDVTPYRRRGMVPDHLVSCRIARSSAATRSRGTCPPGTSSDCCGSGRA